ncbi:anti-sigma factor, partial [Thermus scotoductus]
MTHPDPDDLLRLALDLLPEGQGAGLRAHLRRCPSCRAAYRAYLEA